MPSCTSPILTRRAPAPQAQPPRRLLPPWAGRRAGSGGRLPATGISRRNPFPQQVPARSPVGPPAPHSPCPRPRSGGQGRAGGTAATPPGVPAPPASRRRTEPPLPAPQRGGVAPPPAQRPRREGGGCPVLAPGPAGRFLALGSARRALPPPSRLRPEGRRREGLTGWVRRGLFTAPRLKSESLSSP